MIFGSDGSSPGGGGLQIHSVGILLIFCDPPLHRVERRNWAGYWAGFGPIGPVSFANRPITSSLFVTRSEKLGRLGRFCFSRRRLPVVIIAIFCEVAVISVYSATCSG
jgi:hypothetical protein